MATTIPEPATDEPDDVGTRPDAKPRERLRREDPKRSSPIRSATHYFRDSRSWDEGAPDAPSTGDPGSPLAQTLDDVITHGVHLGYKVIEEHLLKGQKTAERLRPLRPETGAEDNTGGMNAFIGQAQRVYEDFGTLCFDALEAVARSPGLLRALSQVVRKGHESGGDTAGSATRSDSGGGLPPKIVVEVVSIRPTRIDLQLYASARPHRLMAHALHARHSAILASADIRFRSEIGSEVPILSVKVPNDQPPGQYTGVIVDADSNEPVGTLTIRVSDATES